MDNNVVEGFVRQTGGGPGKYDRCDGQYVFKQSIDDGATDGMGFIDGMGFGCVAFPPSKDPKPYLRVKVPSQKADHAPVSVPDEYSPLLLHFFETQWNLQRPKLLIGITGGADPFTVTSELEFLLSDLMNLARHTKAWMISGGTKAGIMEYVGQARYQFGGTIPLIGFASWGKIGERDKLSVEPDDINYGYTTRSPVKYVYRPPAKGGDVALDPNHSHYVLVDDGNLEFGAEIKLRGKFEQFARVVEEGSQEAIAAFAHRNLAKLHLGWEGSCYSTDPDPDTTTSDEGDAPGKGNGANAVRVPAVCLCIQGGPNSLGTVLASIRNETPVVVVQGTGRAADLIGDCVESYQSGRGATLDRGSDGGGKGGVDTTAASRRPTRAELIDRFLTCMSHVKSLEAQEGAPASPNDATNTQAQCYPLFVKFAERYKESGQCFPRDDDSGQILSRAVSAGWKSVSSSARRSDAFTHAVWAGWRLFREYGLIADDKKAPVNDISGSEVIKYANYTCELYEVVTSRQCLPLRLDTLKKKEGKLLEHISRCITQATCENFKMRHKVLIRQAKDAVLLTKVAGKFRTTETTREWEESCRRRIMALLSVWIGTDDTLDKDLRELRDATSEETDEKNRVSLIEIFEAVRGLCIDARMVKANCASSSPGQTEQVQETHCTDRSSKVLSEIIGKLTLKAELCSGGLGEPLEKLFNNINGLHCGVLKILIEWGQTELVVAALNGVFGGASQDLLNDVLQSALLNNNSEVAKNAMSLGADMEKFKPRLTTVTADRAHSVPPPSNADLSRPPLGRSTTPWKELLMGSTDDDEEKYFLHLLKKASQCVVEHKGADTIRALYDDLPGSKWQVVTSAKEIESDLYAIAIINEICKLVVAYDPQDWLKPKDLEVTLPFDENQQWAGTDWAMFLFQLLINRAELAKLFFEREARRDPGWMLPVTLWACILSRRLSVYPGVGASSYRLKNSFETTAKDYEDLAVSLLEKAYSQSEEYTLSAFEKPFRGSYDWAPLDIVVKAPCKTLISKCPELCTVAVQNRFFGRGGLWTALKRLDRDLNSGLGIPRRAPMSQADQSPQTSTSQDLASLNVKARDVDEAGATGSIKAPSVSRLALCIVADAIGVSYYVCPLLSQWFYMYGWAPVSSVINYFLIGCPTLAIFAMLEEMLPIVDLVPTAVIGWAIAYQQAREKKLRTVQAKELGVTDDAEDEEEPAFVPVDHFILDVLMHLVPTYLMTVVVLLPRSGFKSALEALVLIIIVADEVPDILFAGIDSDSVGSDDKGPQCADCAAPNPAGTGPDKTCEGIAPAALPTASDSAVINSATITKQAVAKQQERKTSSVVVVVRMAWWLLRLSCYLSMWAVDWCCLGYPIAWLEWLCRLPIMQVAAGKRKGRGVKKGGENIREVFSKGLNEYLSDQGELFELASAAMFLAAFCISCVSAAAHLNVDALDGVSSVLYGASAFLMWMRTLSFVLVQRELGQFVRVMLNMSADLGFFSIAWGILILAFSVAMVGSLDPARGDVGHAVVDAGVDNESKDPPMQKWNSWWLIRTYLQSLGQDYFEEMTTSASNIFVLVMWPIFNVMLVNLMVAVMNDRYEAAKDESTIDYCVELYNLERDIRSKGRTNVLSLLSVLATVMGAEGNDRGGTVLQDLKRMKRHLLKIRSRGRASTPLGEPEEVAALTSKIKELRQLRNHLKPTPKDASQADGLDVAETGPMGQDATHSKSTNFKTNKVGGSQQGGIDSNRKQKKDENASKWESLVKGVDQEKSVLRRRVQAALRAKAEHRKAKEHMVEVGLELLREKFPTD